MLLIGCSQKPPSNNPQPAIFETKSAPESVTSTIRPTTSPRNQKAENGPGTPAPWDKPSYYLLKMAKEIQNPIQKTTILNQIALAQIHAGNEKEGRETLSLTLQEANQIKNPAFRQTALERIAQTLVELGDVPQAVEIVQRADKVERKYFGLRKVAIALARNGDAKQALEVAQMVDDEATRRYYLLNRIVFELTKAGKLEQALKIARNKLQTTQYTLCLSSIAHALAEMGDRKQTLSVIQELEESRQTISAPADQAELELGIILVLTQIGEFDRCLAAVPKLADDEMRLKVLGEIAAGLAKKGDLKQALKISQALMDPEIRDQSFQQIIRALAGSSRFEDAVSVLDKMEDQKLKADALQIILWRVSEAGDAKLAWELIQTIENPSNRNFPLASSAGDLAKAGKSAEALEMANRIQTQSTKTVAIKGIAEALAERGETTEALALFEQYPTKSPRIQRSILKKIATALLKKGDTEQALAVLQQSLEVSLKAGDVAVLRSELMELAIEPGEEKEIISVTELADLDVGTMKPSFTPAEKKLANQILQMIQECCHESQ
ncbi:hypothetical protein [Gimesia sp.]|uniref:tetratricopeptide repeat protein n=1 Tax=Gimesia sp. TaxID=2024833 RepID=UPI003A9490BC